MMRTINIFLLLLVLVGFLKFASCEKSEYKAEEVFVGNNYFPLKIENSITYKVTEIVIDQPSDFYDTSVYYIKEVVAEFFIDKQNDTAYRIERFKANSLSGDFNIHNVWSAKILDDNAQKKEENVRYVKIRFPVDEDLSWDGNLYNNKSNLNYTITSLNNPQNINSFAFDSTLTVMHKNSISLINKDLAYEVYAYNIGLVYKQDISLNSQEVIPDVPIENRITTGTIFIQEIVDYNINN